MASGALPVDRLRQFLRDLAPGARTLLVAELERAVMRGEEIPGGDMLLREVRAAQRQDGGTIPRLDAPSRAFFMPVEPFLTDAHPDRKLPSRIARASLAPLWTWIARDLIPDECQRYCDDVVPALAAGDAEPPAMVGRFQDLAVQKIAAALDAVRANDLARRKLAHQVATPHALDDLDDLRAILMLRDPLALVASRLPGHIRSLDVDLIESVRATLESPLYARDGLLPYALVLVGNRLAAPWQIICLAVDAAATDDAARIATSPYAPAVTMALAEIERMVDDLKADLRRGATATSLLKSVHDAVRGLRTALDLSADSAWARRLAAIRSDISGALKGEIESTPGRLRRLLRPRPVEDIARGSMLDADEVAETEALVDLVGACRNYASELAASEVTLRTFQEIQHYLDTSTRALLEALRLAGDRDRSFRKSQMDAAIRFCGKAFGQDYAALLVKAAESAEHGDRKLAAKA